MPHTQLFTWMIWVKLAAGAWTSLVTQATLHTEQNTSGLVCGQRLRIWIRAYFPRVQPTRCGAVWAWWMNGENRRFNGPIKRFLECRLGICHLRNMIWTLHILNFRGQEKISESHEYSWKHDNRSFVSIRVLNCYMNIAFIWSWQNFVCENCKVQYRLAKTLS